MPRSTPFRAWAFVALGLLVFALPVWLRAQAVLDADLEQIRAQYNLPGLTAMAIKGGRILASGAAGLRRQGNSTPIRADDLINIASCTKWMTATVAARLADRGVITWTVRVRDVFPDYANFHPAFADVTLEELLAHHGGVEDSFIWEGRHLAWLQAQTGSITQIRRAVAVTALTDAPQVPRGTYLYSNQGYTVAAVMLETAAQKSWETLIAEEVFGPLRMTSARLGITYPTNALPPAGVVGHDMVVRGAPPIPRSTVSTQFLGQYQASHGAGGYVVCTLRDWGRFLHAHAVEGEGYLTPASVQKLRTPFRGSEGYALGVAAVNRPWATPGQALNHNGDIFGQDSVFWVAPGRDFVLMAFTNTATGDGSSFSALDAAIGLLVTRYQNATPSGPLLDETALTAPAITAQPVARTVTAGESVRFEVTAAGSSPLTYQWRFNGADLPGATASAYTIASVSAAHAGNYSVVVTNSAGTVTSNGALLTVSSAADPARLINLSIRTQAGAGAQTLIVGFAVGGTATSGTKPVLLRGVGPTLTQFGVEGALADPQLTLFRNGVTVASNNDWGGSAALANVFLQNGAFALPAASRDAALQPTLENGSYSAQITAAASGIALAEIYDVSPPTAVSATMPRLVNVSARAVAGNGANVLIAGFVVGGAGTKTVLIRGIGPTLAQFGVEGAVANPQLQLFQNGVAIQSNDNWGGGAQLSSAFGQVAAFPLAAASLDAALLVTLAPGQYSAQLSGAANTSGVALIELYEIP